MSFLLINKSKKGILNIVSGVKYNFVVYLAIYVTYVTNFKALYMLLNTLNNT